MCSKNSGILSLVVIIVFSSSVAANNIRVQNTRLTEQNVNGQFTIIQFDVDWENSWRDVENWDAAWIFVKYKRAGRIWQHASLAPRDEDHGAPGGAVIDVGVTDGVGKGVFLYRSSPDSGAANYQGVRLHWNYGQDNVGDDELVQVKVFAVEMVSIPQGTLHLNTEPTRPGGVLNEFISDAGSLTQIDSEDELIEGALRWTKDGNGGGVGNDNGTSYGSAPLAAGFPKGYRAFYCMKYGLSQKQYVDFLNTLTRTQQNARGVSGDSDRNTIVAQAADNGEENPVVFVAERPDRAANFLIWIDGCAYADWAGLRPMTELEFEKAARGNQPVVSEEYAWGTTQIKAGRTLSGLEEDGTEVLTDEGANANYEFSGGLSFSGGDGGQGPLRCGIFAREETTREQAGAGYYGVMDLSGNVTETCVTVAAIKGLNEQPIPGAGQFDGRHGDGVLSENGHADVPNWPGRDENGEVVTAEGSGHRGGSFGSSRFPLSVSDRGSAAEISISPLRTGTGGFRAVRTASQD